MKSFGKLLKRTSLETFERRGNPHYSIKAKVILYRDSLPEMELWLIDNHYNALIKFPLVKGVELGDKGFWTTDDPLAVRRFFDGLK